MIATLAQQLGDEGCSPGAIRKALRQVALDGWSGKSAV
jgi:hypothetical protein